MDNQLQQQVFRAMAAPEFYPHPVSRIQQVETHISRVFLTGTHVYKIKKPLDLGFLDFSTLEKRRHFCSREVALNRRLSTDIYLDVVAVTLDNGVVTLEGTGPVIEYCVRMRQLSESGSLESLIGSGRVRLPDVAGLGRTLARFYRDSPEPASMEGDAVWQNIADACQENFRQTASCSGTLFDQYLWETVRDATQVFLTDRRTGFLQRARSGRVRDCHGDLRTGHIYFTDQGIQIIDCIEFNDRLRHIDIASDLAFLLMDLDFQGRPDLGDLLLEQYLRQTSDIQAFLFLAFYKCYRAVVRCKVNCILLRSPGPGKEERKKTHLDAIRYLDLAGCYARQFSRPMVLVVCGMPATGKSTLAGALANAFGIRVFRSDEVRKRRFGLTPHDNGIAAVGEALYSSSATAATYRDLLDLARQEITRGESVILDATYSRQRYRQEVMALAADLGAWLVFIECTADNGLVKERLLKRESEPTISDARIHQFDMLKARYEPFLNDGSCRHVRADTAVPPDELIRQVVIRSFRMDTESVTMPSRTPGETDPQ